MIGKTATRPQRGCEKLESDGPTRNTNFSHSSLLEINERAGEQFKSALMLTKLISDSNGAPIRFVVLRRKTDTILDDSQVSLIEKSVKSHLFSSQIF